MKLFVFGIALSLFSLSSFADYKCYPSAKNEFMTDELVLKVGKTKVSFDEASSPTRVEATFKNMVGEGVNEFANFEHGDFSPMKRIRNQVPSDYFGEGSGEMYVSTSILNNSGKGRMAVAWCAHWCHYDYYNCYPVR